MKSCCLACILAGMVGAILLLASGANTSSAADKAAESRQVLLGEGKLVLTAPAEWERKQPRSRIVEHEFAAPAAAENQAPGRLTIMGAGGSVEDNVNRWAAQFVQAEGTSAQDAVKTETKKIAGMDVQIVDISGTYKDQPAGPFAGGQTVMREKYRMLAAIIVSGDKEVGNYFLKFYGPQATIKAQEKAFLAMVESLQKK